MRRRFFITPLLFLSIVSNSQNKSIPEEAKPFLPAGMEILDYITGDLNGDKKPDGILIAKQPGEDTLMDAEMNRPMIILLRQANGTLKQALRNDAIIMCRHCGGVFGDPYEGITVKPRGFEISFYGGSSWRWGYTYSFVYRSPKNNWFLVKEKQVSFQSGDPEKTMKETTIYETELGEISLDRFSSEAVYEDGRWKVIAAKTYFYDNPRLGAVPRKAFLIKGNLATGIRTLKNFVELSYENSKGEITQGFVLKKDLQLQKQ